MVMVEAARGTGGKPGWNARGTGLEVPSEAMPAGRCAESARTFSGHAFLCHIVAGVSFH